MTTPTIFFAAKVTTVTPFLDDWLGLQLPADELGFSHMAWRSLVVFLFSVLLMRVGVKRLLGHNAAMDVMLAVILGSVLSRAINGQADFFPTLGAGLVLVLLHRLLAMASLRSHWVSLFAKGRDRVLVRQGQVDREALRHATMTEDDLLENLRLHGNIGSAAEAEEARLERNGTVSVIKRRS